MKVLLLSECLQNEFVAPLPPGAPLPNALHIGRAESRRLLGDPLSDWKAEGPLARFLAAWSAGAGPDHASIHIRDWHDATDRATRSHLDHFGAHCLQGSEGARFVAPLEAAVGSDQTSTVDAAILSDFVGTDLEVTVKRFVGDQEEVRVGLIGVWTDVKVRYLAYDLTTRMGLTDIAVCSALTASRSRIHHRQALEHLGASLGVVVIDSIPEFLSWLRIAGWTAPTVGRASPAPEVRMPDTETLGEEERRLVEYLFRDCREVALEPLSGGFSGSRVFRTASTDRRGMREVPFVVKIDTHAKIGRERVAVEGVENLLGAASPRLSEYVDLETLGAIKYQFATMHGGEVRTLQRAFRAAATPDETGLLIENVIARVLRRLYQAPVLDRLQLFRYYDFQQRYAKHALARVSALAESEVGVRLRIAGLDGDLPHPGRAYRRVEELLAEEAGEVACCWVHGDLNLANVLLDTSGNTWMIDYYWTRIGHALHDVAKLENDIKFILVPLADDEALRRVVSWERLLLSQDDLLAPPPALGEALAADLAVAKAHAAIVTLRRLASEVLVAAGLTSAVSAREYRIAQLRYSAHTLSFDECDLRQKRFALASTCLLAERVA
ncbi:MAG TPA: phosphotransferase [Vicinamibacteria bacterium]|nr:phosphotransferase [Vicinamibacteria bacterium]